MASTVPLLLSMSLIGIRGLGVQEGFNDISRELQAPPRSPQGYMERSRLAETEHQRVGAICVTSSTDSDWRSADPPLAHQGSAQHELNLYSTLRSRDDLSRGASGRAIGSFNRVTPFTGPSGNRLHFHTSSYGFGRERIEDEYVGSAMELVYAWSTVDFEFENIDARDSAIFEGEYIAENNLPLGLEVWRDKVFLTLPKWKDGIPATLTTVPKRSITRNPKLRPYPDWDWNHPSDTCHGFTSVFRIQVDECDRLWILDSGKVNLVGKPKQLCPPSLFIFDLITDTPIRKYVLPDDQVKQDSLYTNIVVDVRNKDCASARAYLSDVWRFGIVVYDFFKDSSFRFEHHLFFPDPLASRYELHGIKFQWTDGIFGVALSPVDAYGDRTLFFHPMSSFREFALPVSMLEDEKIAMRSSERLSPIGRPRAKDYGHSSGSAVDRSGVMFFNMVTRDSVWCWDTRKEYIPQNLGVVGTSNVSLVFPNDLRIDHELEQNLWLISNKLPMYLYGNFDPSSVNYRVYRAKVRDAVRDTVCDPNYIAPDSEKGYDDTC